MDGPTDEREAVLGPALLALSLSAPLSPGEALRAHPQTVGAAKQAERTRGAKAAPSRASRPSGTVARMSRRSKATPAPHLGRPPPRRSACLLEVLSQHQC